MSENIEIVAEPRETFGKAGIRRMRRLDSTVPAIIYGAKGDAVAIQMPFRIIKRRLEDEHFYSSVLHIKIGSKLEKVILKAVQRHPGRGDVIHVDFLRIDEKKVLTISVPLHFVNEEMSPGIKNGGVVSNFMNELEISCLPSDIPEFISVDIGAMENGDVLHLSSIVLPKGVELVVKGGDDLPVVSVAEPKLQAETEAGIEEGKGDETEEGETKA